MMKQLIAALLLGVGNTALAAEALPPAAIIETASIEGLAAPGEIIVDHWGIAHVYGATTRDAFFLQGYNAARDRLWQIDLWRKRGLGRLAASFGPEFVERDRAARLFLYRGDMGEEWANYPAEAKGWTEAFVAGINARIAEIEAGRAPLPMEFGLTASKPERWQAEDVVRIRSNALVSNLAGEVLRARSVCLGGLPYEPLRRKVEPAHRIVVPKGLDPCLVTPDVMTDYRAATGNVVFEAGKVVAEVPSLEQLARRYAEMGALGSNNWVVAASNSATGRPILANDPHREHSVPSLRYLVGVNAPDLKIIGAGEPALPGITFGHNGTSAWGITIFYVDQQDLYVYETSADGTAYRVDGKWEPFTVRREAVAVKGGPDRTVDLLFTRHGPVIAKKDGHAFAVRSVWDKPGASGYFNAGWMLRAKGWTDFEKAHQQWGTPPLNLVYADTAGDIGWMPSAFAPVRPGWDGLMPVPGDGRFEWQGLTAPGLFPAVKNPARGWFATANEMNLPPGFDNERIKLGFEWVDRSRITAIESALAAKPKLGLADMMAIQTTTDNPLARQTVAMLKGLEGDTPDARAAIAMLTAWDAHSDADSAAAALYEVWVERHLRSAVVDAVVPEAARPAFADPQQAAVVDWLARPDMADKRGPLLNASLAAAWAETRKLLGDDPSKWQWGTLHRAQWTPAVAALASPAQRAQMSVGPLAVGGSGATPMAMSYRDSDFGVTAGASVRMVLDVGAWDNSRVINTPGQSGDPMSRHYRDLFPHWAAGGYVPLLYSREAVVANAGRVIKLTPAR
jgi:penicillin amidase